MPRTDTQRRRAVTFVRRMLDNSPPLSGRLPGIRRLAQSAGVSPCTMGAALKLLTAEGLVETRVRGGVWMADGCPPGLR